MAARDVVRRIPTYLVGALACFAMFDIPSAYAYFRGAPWGLALAVGLLVFPVLPVGWHVWAERRAKKAEKPKPRKTTGLERFVFRTIVVAILCVGGLILAAGGRVWSAIKSDALWFVPSSAGSLEPDSKLLDKVPPSAQLVVWLRPTDDANALVGKLAPGTSVTEVVVGARVDPQDKNAGEVFVTERGELVIPLLAQLQSMVTAFTKQNGLPLSAWGSVVSDNGGVKTWSTPGWTKEIGTGRAPVLDLVKRAPSDAFLVAVAKLTPTPSTTTPSTTTPSTTTPSTTTPSTTTPSTTTPSTTTPSTTTPSTTTPSTTTPSTTTPSTTTPSTTTPSTTTPSTTTPSTTTPSTTTPSTTTPSTTTPSTTTPSPSTAPTGSSSSFWASPSMAFAKVDPTEEAIAQGITLVAWVRAPRERVEIDATLDAANEAAAAQLLELVNGAIAEKEKSDAKVIACYRKHSDELYVRREGTKLHARVVFDLDGMKGLFNCLDMAKK